MVPGISSESLALDVALQCQVPPDIVYRAAQLFKVQHLPAPGPLSPTCWIFVLLLPICSRVAVQVVLFCCAFDRVGQSAVWARSRSHAEGTTLCMRMYYVGAVHYGPGMRCEF